MSHRRCLWHSQSRCARRGGVAGYSIPDILLPISSQGAERGPLEGECRSMVNSRAREGHYHETGACLRGPTLRLYGTEEGSYHGCLDSGRLEVVPVRSLSDGNEAIARNEARKCRHSVRHASNEALWSW
jgi:hypothetical protein